MFSDFIHLALKALSSLYLYLSALFLLLYVSGYTLFEELIDFVFFFFSFLIDAHSLKKDLFFGFSFAMDGEWGLHVLTLLVLTMNLPHWLRKTFAYFRISLFYAIKTSLSCL